MYHRLVCSLILAAFACTVAEAQENDTGFGISVSAGATRISDDDGDEGSFRGDGAGFAIDFEYRFVPNFAVGFGYIFFGETTDTVNGVATEIDAAATDLFVRAIYPLNDTVELYGRLGAALYTATVVPDLGFEFDGAWEAGVGLDIGRRENFSFRLEGRFLNGGSDESAALLSAGVSYLF